MIHQLSETGYKALANATQKTNELVKNMIKNGKLDSELELAVCMGASERFAKGMTNVLWFITKSSEPRVSSRKSARREKIKQ